MSNFFNNDASAVLKSILSIGQPEVRSVSRSSDSSTISLPGSLQKTLDGISYAAQSRDRASSETPSVNSVFTDSGSVFNLQPEKQTIALDGTEQHSTHAIHSSNVEVLSSKLSGSPSVDTPTSSKVENKRMMRQSWDHNRHPGNMVAVHYLSAYIAYVVKGKRSWSSTAGSLAICGGSQPGAKDLPHSHQVYVVNQRTVQRVKLMDFTTDVVDLGFARSTEALLAVLNDLGALYVYSLNPGLEDRLNSRCIVKIPSPYPSPGGISSPHISHYKRVCWCPYVPPGPQTQDSTVSEATSVNDEEVEDDLSVLLAVALHDTIDVWNVEVLRKRYSYSEIPSDIQYGKISINNQHTRSITELVFSPDGTPLASACADGYVRFFSIDINATTQPKCLQKWKPHSGLPVSALVFLDDLKNVTSDSQFWKYAVTGATDNTELKLWSCETWTCLQTLTIHPAPNVPSQFILQPCLKLAVDPSARYLALSDVRRKVLYVCKLRLTSSSASIASISEYLINQSCLSFQLIDTVLPGLETGLVTVPTSATTGESMEAIDYNNTAILRLYSIIPSGLYLTTLQVPADKETLDLLFLPFYSFNLRLFKSRSVESSLASSDVECGGDICTPTHTHTHRSVDDSLRPADKLLTSTPNDQQQHEPMVRATDGGSHVASSSQSILDQLFSHSKQQTILQANEQRETREKINSASNEQTIKLTKDKLSEQTIVPSSTQANILSSESNEQTNAYTNISPIRQTNSSGEINEQSSERTNGQTTVHSSLPADQVFNESHCEAERGVQSVQNGSAGDDAVNMEDLKTIMELVSAQQEAINSLREELVSQSQRSLHAAPSEELSSAVSTAVSRDMQSSEEELRRLAEGLDRVDRESAERLTTSITHMLQVCVRDSVQPLVQEELRKSVLPVVTRSLEPVLRRLLNDYTQKIAATDSLLRDSISKMIRAKKTTDAIAEAVSSTVETSLSAACVDMFAGSFSKGCEEIGRQLDSSFRAGLRQHIQSQGELVSRQMTKGEEMWGEVEGLAQSMRAGAGVEPLTTTLCTELITLTQALQTSVGQTSAQQLLHLQQTLHAATDRLADTLRDSLSVMIREEIDSALRDHQSIISERIITTFNSRSATPAPLHPLSHLGGATTTTPQQLRTQIQAMLQQHQYNTAFNQALVAADLGLVMYVCEMVDPTLVFTDNDCALQQTTLLSLIQQLSVDLNNETLLKHRYLEEAVMKLDMQNLSTREHAPVVLRTLHRALDSFLSSKQDLEHSTRRQMRMLNIAVEALLGGASR